MLWRFLWPWALLLAGWASFATSAWAATSRPDFGPPPAWVKAVVVSAADPASTPDAQLQDGIYNLLVDRQTRAGMGAQQQYRHFASQALSMRGVEELAQVDIDFDPSFQQLRIHSIGVWRAGQWQSRLQPAQMRVLQQERDLRRLVYDGTRTAHFVLDDVRVGDVVEFAYTLTGHNPVFGEAHFGGFAMQWRTPVRQAQARLLWPSRRFLQTAAPDLAPEQRMEGNGWQEYRWQATNVPGLTVRKDTPDDYLPLARVYWSGMAHWGAVARWAIPLYAPGEVRDPALRTAIDEIARTHATDAGRAMAVLQFVQRNIRYMAIAVGEGSYAPRAPHAVLAQRFGDCKDKTLLALTMLHALGIEAHAALVNTRIGSALTGILPMPSAFDHVLLRVRVDGQDYWLDPTKTLQHGTLDTISQARQTHALVIALGDQGLQAIPVAAANTKRKSIKLVYAAPAGDATGMNLMVQTDHEGLAAEFERAYLADEGSMAAQKNFLEFYQRSYKGLQRIKDFVVEDDLEHNRLRVTEHYRIADFWKKREGGREPSAFVRMPDIRSVLKTPDMPREQPFAQEHTVEVLHTTVLHLPGQWPARDAWKHSVENPAFDFSATFHPSDRELVWEHHYRSKTGEIPVADLNTYVTDIEKADDLVGDTVGRTPRSSDKKSDYTLLFVLAPTAILLAYFGMAGWRQARALAAIVHPETRPHPPRRIMAFGGRVLRGLVALYLRPHSFFANADRLRQQPGLLLAASIAGLLLACSLLDTMIAWLLNQPLQDDSGVRGLAASWLHYWTGVALLWVPGIALEWYVGGWWFRQRLRWSGAATVESLQARSVYVFQCLFLTLPFLIYNVVCTLLFADWSAAVAGATPITIIALVLSCLSVRTGYAAATTAFEVSRIRARFWFGVLPLLWYGGVLGSSLWWGQ